MKKENLVYVIYLRLSDKDHECGDESNSIINQRMLIQDYIRDKPQFENVDFLEVVDDGYSGMHFNRPGIKKILSGIEKHKINGVIVKDFSRFGRNFVEVGDYICKKFPLVGVHFISVCDVFDSREVKNYAQELDNIFRQLRNHIFSQDLSFKVSDAKRIRSQTGYYLGSYGFYGYVKDSEKKGQLNIDHEAAEVVKRIFQDTIRGISQKKIAKALNQEGVLTPKQYKVEKFHVRPDLWRTAKEDVNYWSRNQIYRILSDERYTGKLISGKRKATVIGGKRGWSTPKEDWIVVPNHHEGIISEEDFWKANEMKLKNNKNVKKKSDNKGLLTGKVICGNCNLRMKRSGKKTYSYYCEMQGIIPDNLCPEPIKESLLEQAVIRVLQKQALLADVLEKIAKINEKKALCDDSKLENEIKRIQQEIERNTQERIWIYEQFVDGKLTKEGYMEKKQSYNDTIALLEQTHQKLLEEQQSKLEKSLLNDCQNYLICYKEQKGIIHLTREVVDQLVESIVVYNHNTIKVNLKYLDIFQNINLF